MRNNSVDRIILPFVFTASRLSTFFVAINWRILSSIDFEGHV